MAKKMARDVGDPDEPEGPMVTDAAPAAPPAAAPAPTPPPVAAPLPAADPRAVFCTLQGGGPVDGPWPVEPPIPGVLIARGAVYDLQDRAGRIYNYRHNFRPR